MVAAADTLLALTAGDLMSREVVAVPEGMPLREAARLLLQSRVSGAPVVDPAGRCVGVLSAADVVRGVVRREPGAGHPGRLAADPEELPGDEVRKHMTPDPVTVRPDTPLGTLARMMIDAGIHRVIVTDGGRHPVGVVSSTDVLAALARLAGPPVGGGRP
jgi:CBS-domain-containing membrane protein